MATWLLGCCAGEGGHTQCRSSRKRTNLSATRAMTVTITTEIKQHSSVYNALWRSRSIPACTAAADWKQLSAQSWSNYRSKHMNIIKLKRPGKGPAGGYWSGGTGDSPLAVNLWWFWSFSPSPLWEIWSKGKQQTKESHPDGSLFLPFRDELRFIWCYRWSQHPPVRTWLWPVI